MRHGDQTEAVEQESPISQECPAPALVPWLNEVGSGCHVGISLEVHDMEVQFWEMFTPDEFPQPVTLPGIYASHFARKIQHVNARFYQNVQLRVSIVTLVLVQSTRVGQSVRDNDPGGRLCDPWVIPVEVPVVVDVFVQIRSAESLSIEPEGPDLICHETLAPVGGPSFHALVLVVDLASNGTRVAVEIEALASAEALGPAVIHASVEELGQVVDLAFAGARL
jgi:hypothetical protein